MCGIIRGCIVRVILPLLVLEMCLCVRLFPFLSQAGAHGTDVRPQGLSQLCQREATALSRGAEGQPHLTPFRFLNIILRLDICSHDLSLRFL